MLLPTLEQGTDRECAAYRGVAARGGGEQPARRRTHQRALQRVFRSGSWLDPIVIGIVAKAISVDPRLEVGRQRRRDIALAPLQTKGLQQTAQSVCRAPIFEELCAAGTSVHCEL